MKLLNVDEAIESLEELGFQVNELKQKGEDAVPLKAYETLLDWAIESVMALRDHYEKQNTYC